MPAAPDLLARPPERLVILGFRNLMAACELGDVACWEAVWQHYIAELGPRGARQMLGELQYWARALRRHAERPLAFYPPCCRFLCHDECMALSLVAAAQVGDRLTGGLAARHLSGQSDPEALAEMWEATLPFAEALGDAGKEMYPVSAEVVESIVRLQLAGRGREARRHLN